MFRAIWRLIRGIGYLFTGRIDGFADQINRDPHAVQSGYRDIIEQKKASLDQYIDAVGSLIAQRETKTQRLKSLTSEIEKLERLRAGAIGKAKEITAGETSRGMSPENIKQNPEFVLCQSSYRDFSSTLESKKSMAEELESSIREYDGRINGHKIKLTSLKREVEQLKAEMPDAVADILGAKQEEKIDRVIAGISNNTSDEKLQQLRDTRNKAKANAKIISEMAGTDHKKIENEFETFATNHQSDDEFDAAVGLLVPDKVKIEMMEEQLKNIPDTIVA